MSRIQTILCEAVTQPLYHFTGASNAISIIQNDMMYATPVAGTESDMKVNRNKFYFISFTRSKDSGYKSGHTKIVFNGASLSQQYKIVPVDYWGFEKSLPILRDGMEKEDRLVTNKHTIVHIRKHIMEVHCYTQTGVENLSKLYDVCHAYNIPVYFYTMEKDFLSQNPKGRIDLDSDRTYRKFLARYAQTKDDKQENGEEDEQARGKRLFWSMDAIIPMLIFNDPELEQKVRSIVGDVAMNMLTSIHLSPQNLRYKMDLNDFVRQVAGQIHSSKLSSRRSMELQKVLDLLRLDMKKHKAPTLSEYIQKKMGVYEYIQNAHDGKEDKNTKVEYELYDEDGRYVKWDTRVDSWTDIGNIMRELPKRVMYAPRTIRLFNKKTLTFAALYNFLVKEFGRKYADDMLREQVGFEVRKA